MRTPRSTSLAVVRRARQGIGIYGTDGFTVRRNTVVNSGGCGTSPFDGPVSSGPWTSAIDVAATTNLNVPDADPIAALGATVGRLIPNLSEPTDINRIWNRGAACPRPDLDYTTGPATSRLVTTFTNVRTGYHSGCSSSDPTSATCAAGIHRLCQAQGYVGGFGPVQHVNDTLWYACVTGRAGRKLEASIAQLGSYNSLCSASNPVSDVCASAVERNCQANGYASGFGPSEFDGVKSTLVCASGAAVDPRVTTFTRLRTFNSACTESLAVSNVCRSAVDRLCIADGYASGFGVVQHAGDTAWITCLRTNAN